MLLDFLLNVNIFNHYTVEYLLTPVHCVDISPVRPTQTHPYSNSGQITQVYFNGSESVLDLSLCPFRILGLKSGIFGLAGLADEG